MLRLPAQGDDRGNVCCTLEAAVAVAMRRRAEVGRSETFGEPEIQKKICIDQPDAPPGASGVDRATMAWIGGAQQDIGFRQYSSGSRIVVAERSASVTIHTFPPPGIV